MENQWNSFWLQSCLCPLATALVNSGRQEWASSQWTHLGGRLLGLLFCILTPLRCLFGFFLHPGNIDLQFLLPAEEASVLKQSSTLIRQVEARDAKASWSVEDTQGEWARASSELCYRQPQSAKLSFQLREATLENSPLPTKASLNGRYFIC